MWISTNGYYSTDQYYYLKSKNFTIPAGTSGLLNLRSLSFVRNWTFLVKKNTDGTETETQITATTYMSDGAKGWLNSRSPAVNNYNVTSGDYYIKVKLYCNNNSVRPSVDVNANVLYDVPSCTTSLPTVVSPVTYCQNSQSLPLNATGSNLLWYTTPTGGIGSTTPPTPSTTTVGTVSYYVSQTNSCESSRAKIDVIVNAMPSLPQVTTPVTYCQNAAASSLSAVGSGLLWYNAETGGTGSSSPPTPVTASAGTTSYYVSQTINGCEGARAKIDVVVNPSSGIALTSPSGTNNQSIDLGLSIQNISYTLSSGLTNAIVTGLPDGVNSVINGNTITISGTSSVGGSYKYTIQATGNCGTASVEGTINVLDWTLAPNSYIFTGKDDKKNDVDGIFIPIKKAFAMWSKGKYMGSSSIPNGIISADVLWEDTMGLLKSKENYQLDFVDINNQVIGKNQINETSRIKVKIDKIKKGNAVVAFRVGNSGTSSDEIYWSWHVWATDDPTNGTTYKSYDNMKRELSNGNIEDIAGGDWGWMDRNLGAVGNTLTGIGWNKNGGLLYQWGRKDPIPPLVTKGNGFYEISGTVGNVIHRQAQSQTAGYKKIDDLTKYVSQSTGNVKDNIRLSVKNPLSLIYVNQDNTSNQANYATINGVYYDVNWFGSVPGLQTYELSKVDLWSDNSKGSVDSDILQNYNDPASAKPYRNKSSYDPCPNGWRIPSFLVAHTTNNVRTDYSPYGVRQNINGSTVYSGGQGISNIKPMQSSLPDYLKGIKVYPQFGFDMSNVGGYNLGVFPGTGMIDRRDHGGQYSDGHETYLWTATMTMWDQNNLAWSTSARALRLIPDAGQIINNYKPDANYNNIFGLYNYIPVYNFTTNKAMGCRCIKDPLFEKNSYNFKTDFIPLETIKYTEGLDDPNAYLITKNSVAEIKIPVTKAFAVQSQILNNPVILEPAYYNNLKANVLWSDRNDLVTNVIVENPNPSSLSQITNTKIVVKIAPNKVGNAIITLHNGNTSNPIYWSWHVWVSNTPVDSLSYVNDTPIQTDNYVNYTNYGNVMKTKFMDRNLGAIDAFPNVVNITAPTTAEMNLINNSQGLHYQWGRKDPIPVFLYPSGSGYSIYLGNTNPTTGVVTYTTLTSSSYDTSYPVSYSTYKSSISATDKIDIKVSKILKYSVENPLRFMKPDAAFSPFPNSTNPVYTNGADWLFDNQHSNLYSERWGWGAKKSVFDPCPKGWRIPDPISGLTGSGKKNSPWSFKNNDETTNTTLGNTDQGYYGKIVTTAGWGTTKGFIFNDTSYKVGSYPKGYIRGQRSVLYNDFAINHSLSLYNIKSLSGIWYSSLSTNFYGRGSYLGFDRFGRMQISNTDLDPYSAMNCRCVKQEDTDVGSERGPIPTIPVLPNTGVMAKSIFTKAEIASHIEDEKLRFYPIPVKDKLYIDVKDIKVYFYQIYNTAGQIVKEGKFDDKQANLQSLTSGIYFIRINDAKELIKIIKE